jgi:hypothetical protein
MVTNRQRRPCGFQEVKVPIFQDNWHMNVVRLSDLPLAALTPREIFLVLISVKRQSRLHKDYVNEIFELHHQE